MPDTQACLLPPAVELAADTKLNACAVATYEYAVALVNKEHAMLGTRVLKQMDSVYVDASKMDFDIGNGERATTVPLS